MDPVFISRAVRHTLNVIKGEEPEDQPSQDDMIRKLNSMKANIRKERDLLSAYMMPKRYAVVLEGIVRENGKIEQEDIAQTLCQKFGIDLGTEKEDFPSVAQLNKKVNAARTQLRKESSDAKYKMSQVYVDTITVILETRPGVKLAEVEDLVLEYIGVGGGEELADFPSVAEFKKFTSIRKKYASQTAVADGKQRAGTAVLGEKDERKKQS